VGVDGTLPPGRSVTVARVALQVAFWVPLAICTWLALIPEPPDNPIFRLSDVILHSAAFTYLSLALVLARLHGNRTPSYLSTAVFMICYGVLIEVVQGFIPERSSELKDLLVDSVGIALGLLLARWLARPVYDGMLRLSARL